MTFIQIIFYAFATVAVLSAVAVVAAKNPVHGALSLVLTFVAMSGVWMILQAEFLALILVLVYVGAVMTLFLFVVMMLSVNRISFSEGFVKYLPVALGLVIVVMGMVMMGIGPQHFGLEMMPLPPSLPSDFSNTAELGSVLYTQYALPFEMAGVILLTAIVAAITLTHHRAYREKRQQPSKQIAVKRDQRVRLISMPSEGKPKTEGGAA